MAVRRFVVTCETREDAMRVSTFIASKEDRVYGVAMDGRPLVVADIHSYWLLDVLEHPGVTHVAKALGQTKDH